LRQKAKREDHEPPLLAQPESELATTSVTVARCHKAFST
jgi:hypothetical protein